MTRTWVSRLAPAAAFQFCFIAATAMLKPAANALVLSRFQAGALPYLYMAAAILTGGFAAWTAGRPSRRSSPSLLAWFGGGLSVLLALGVTAQVPLISLVAYLFAEAFATQVSLSFWGALGEAFDARESRRAFTWINGIGMSGAICGGLLAQLLARAQGALSLMVFGGGLLMAGAVAWRFHHSALETRRERAANTPEISWAKLVEQPYVRLLAWLVVAFSVVQQLTDFVFRHRAVARLSESAMADVFASHQLWTGVVCVVFQLVLAEVVMRRLGLLRTVAAVPVIVGGLTITAAVVPDVWSAWALKLFESAATWSLLPVAMQLLYAPLPDASRDAVRRTIDGLVRKGGMGLAGVLLAALAQAAGVEGVLIIVVALCCGLVVLLWRLRPRYVAAVHERVAGVRDEALEHLEDRMLVVALQDPAAAKSLRAAELLNNAGLVQEHHARLMLTHPHERVRERGVKLAAANHFTALAKLLEGLVSEGVRRPRDEAVWALARLSPERARAVLPPLLASKDVGLRCAAVGGLLSLPGPRDDRGVAALDALIARGARAPAAERRETARLLGRLRDARLAPALQRYLEDSDPTVRGVAISAAGEGAYAALAPKLMCFLSWRDERRGARAALAEFGDTVVPLLAETLDDRGRSLSLRLQLPRVLRLIGTQAALEALLFSNAQDEPALHYRVGVSLARIREEHPHLLVEPRQVSEALRRRRETSRALAVPLRDLRAALGARSLLTRVISDRLDQAMELSFWLMGLASDGRGLRRAHAHLTGGDPRRRAWSLELLDNLLTPAQLTQVREQLEERAAAAQMGDASRLLEHLGPLYESEDSVLRACARSVARARGVRREPIREDEMSDLTLQRLFALEGVEIFEQSDVDDLAAVAAVAREQRFRKGERIYAEGDPGDALYVIIEGRVEARRDSEVVLTLLSKESFGETSLFDGAPRINEVVATEDTCTLVIDRRDFLDLLADRPELLSGMFRVLSRQLKDVVVEMATLRGTSAENALPTDAHASLAKRPR